MELKKNENRDISKFRTLFRNVGLIVALVMTITAFEWKWEEIRIIIPEHKIESGEIVYVPPTAFEDPKPQEAKPPKPESKVELNRPLIEVDNDTKLEDEFKPTEEELTRIIEGEGDDYPPEEIVDLKQVFLGAQVEEASVPVIEYKKWYRVVGEYCAENMREIDKMNKGVVYVSFIIERDGSLSELTVLKGINKRLDALVVKSVKKGGKWKPAKMGLRKVRQKMTLPIRFS